MQPRLFLILLYRISDKSKKKIDVSKIKLLTTDEREDMVMHIIRNRGPVVKDLIPRIRGSYLGYPNFRAWMAGMGYLYETKGGTYTFIHTAAHKIR